MSEATLSDAPALSAIQGFLRVDATLSTAGQPTAAQLDGLAAAGVAHVINLALPTSTDAVGDEAARVTGQGLNYLQLPVNWEAPELIQFQRFCQLLWVLREEQVFVHCARNKRVSAFVFLYRVLHEAVPVAEAADMMHRIWVPNEAWLRFIESVLEPSGEYYQVPDASDA